MINIILPNFYNLKILNYNLLDLYIKHKEYFIIDDLNFESAEGSFPFTFWDGSGINNLKISNIPSFASYDIINNFLNVPYKIGLDISNLKITEENVLYDTQLNLILSILENGSNYIILSNLNFLKLIRDKFPHYYFVGSLYNTDIYNKELLRQKILFKNLEENQLQKNKIEVVLPLKCGNCFNFLECKNKEMLQQYTYSENSICNNCEKNFNIDFNSQIEILSKKGYRTFSFDITGIPKNNIKYMAYFYCINFIKKEYYFQAYQFLTGEKYE